MVYPFDAFRNEKDFIMKTEKIQHEKAAHIFETTVIWSQVDANRHLRHSAYADLAAQARIELIESIGLDAAAFMRHHIGPVLFREELIYLKEIRPNARVQVFTQLSKLNREASKWSFLHELYRSDGKKAAIIHVDGAWMDTQKRKLAKLPEDFLPAFSKLPRSDDFTFI